VDCGGIIDDRNKLILNNCTHAILVSSDPQKSSEWKKSFPDIKYLAEIDSFLNVEGKIPLIKSFNEETGTFKMDLINLDRDNHNIQIPEKFLEYFLNA
jgi:hypothetical protein